MQQILHDTEVFDNITEITISVIGITIVVEELRCAGQETRFCLTVADLDSKTPFKRLFSDSLEELLIRQHQLVLGFTQ